MRILSLLIFALLATTRIGHANSGDIYVSFLATPTEVPSSPGHAFLCIELILDSGIKEDCFGFYPKSMGDSFNGQGTVEKELSRTKNRDRFSKVTVSLRHKINEETRREIYSEIQKWSGADYDLIVNNCGDMVFAVAKVSGLVTPDRSTVLRPTEFVSGLKNSYWRGQWISSDPGSRFALVAEGDGLIKWTENSSNGSSLTKTVAFTPKDAEATISRENTSDVLTFLGFQPSLRNEILAAGPKPSFLKLRRENRRIEAEWFGLTATKDANAHLKELKQPGTERSKLYTFDRIP